MLKQFEFLLMIKHLQFTYFLLLIIVNQLLFNIASNFLVFKLSVNEAYSCDDKK